MKLDDWRQDVDQCNMAMNQVYSALSKKREYIVSEVEKLCNSYDLPVKKISVSSDCTVLTVYFDANTSNTLHFPRKFLLELNMSFSVKRELDALANNVLFLEIYPFLDWE